MKFWVTEEEKRLIDEKMKLLPTQRYGAYLRKMAIDGYIIYTDMSNLKEMNKTLFSIGRNINQIAKKLNAGGPAYQADMDEIRERLDQIWQLQRRIVISLCSVIQFTICQSLSSTLSQSCFTSG